MSLLHAARRGLLAPLSGLALVGLTACDPNLMFTGAGVVSFVATDKTLTDHAVSLALDRDCSAVRSSRGESYCAAEAYVMPSEYCYRTLAKVTCYTRPDPQASAEAWVVDVPEMPEGGTGLDLANIFGDTDGGNKTDTEPRTNVVQVGADERSRSQR
jgi:hypothetical protein